MNDIREAAYPGGNFVSTGSVTHFFNLKMKIFNQSEFFCSYIAFNISILFQPGM